MKLKTEQRKFLKFVKRQNLTAKCKSHRVESGRKYLISTTLILYLPKTNHTPACKSQILSFAENPRWSWVWQEKHIQINLCSKNVPVQKTRCIRPRQISPGQLSLTPRVACHCSNQVHSQSITAVLTITSNATKPSNGC